MKKGYVHFFSVTRTGAPPVIAAALCAGIAALLLCVNPDAYAAQTVKLGFIYPKTGSYALVGADEFQGARLAVKEVNSAGGIQGKKLSLVSRDTGATPETAVSAAADLIDKQGARMIFGGATSSVALAVSDQCQKKNTLFMATVAGTPSLTGSDAHRCTFRVGYNSWMDASALAFFLNEHYPDKKYFYITFDAPLGKRIESNIRQLTGTEDTGVHKSVLTPFPTAKPDDFRRAIKAAEKENPDVLLMVQLGKNISTGIMQATVLGVKDRMQVVVPFLELTSTQGLPPKLLEEVIGTTDWAWQVPFRFRYRRGMSFVDTFKKTYNRYPSWGAVTAYTAVHEYADAVRRAGSFDTAAVIRALEGHEFVLLKNKQTWRSFDHQCVQSVYILRGKPASEAVHDESRRDVFEVLTSIPGSHCARSRDDFELVRKNAGKSVSLEPLPE